MHSVAHKCGKGVAVCFDMPVVPALLSESQSQPPSGIASGLISAE